MMSAATTTATAKDVRSGPAWGKIATIALVIAALAAMWRYTPLREYLTPERVFNWAQTFGRHWWAPIVVMAAYTPACFTMFPRPLITLFAVLAFGPWLGFTYAMTGILLAALVTYVVGMKLPADTVRRLAGSKMDQVTEVVKRRGLIACFALRVVPAAPFAIEGFIAGNVGIKLRDFLLGTFLGMLPGTLTTTVFGNQIEAALEDFSKINWWLVGGVVAVFAVLIWFVKRWFEKQSRATR
ncbi:MAG TPA: VTT domain-containing protein [Casimicrobiaceae bacterium]|nr:VTT domain-containing protein [Casimicrobiaceae bacterium]